MILFNNIVEISKNRWIGYMLKVAFLLASSVYFSFLVDSVLQLKINIYLLVRPLWVALDT